jgi:V8-like Glu-specific endopeptidase
MISLRDRPISNVKLASRRVRQATQKPPIGAIPRPIVPVIVSSVKRITRADVDREAERVPITHANIPQFLDYTYFPIGIVKEARITLRAKSKVINPLFVFSSPDQRKVFDDTSYPWITIGKVITPRGSGTGALVGPRHLLTCSHIIDWNPEGAEFTAGWVHFIPSYFDGPRFGDAWGTNIYFYHKEGPNPSGDSEVAEDYVLVVLDNRLGDSLGWMGTRVYSEDWDGDGVFTHVGYPTAVSSERPPFQGGIAFEDSDSPGFFESGDGLDMENEADLSRGDSGGPFLAHWESPVPGPYVIGVTSGEGGLGPQLGDPLRPLDADNWAGGGKPMVHIVKRGRDEFP